VAYLLIGGLKVRHGVRGCGDHRRDAREGPGSGASPRPAPGEHPHNILITERHPTTGSSSDPPGAPGSILLSGCDTNINVRMLDSDEYSPGSSMSWGTEPEAASSASSGRSRALVTELSERLTLSPKALIEHLALMEQMELLGSYMDERRRKYYYLTRDISVMVSFRGAGEGAAPPRSRCPAKSTLTMVRRMNAGEGGAHHNSSSSTRTSRQEDLTDLARQGGDLLSGRRAGHHPRPLPLGPQPREIREFMDMDAEVVAVLLRGSWRRGCGEEGGRYSLRGIDGAHSTRIAWLIRAARRRFS